MPKTKVKAHIVVNAETMRRLKIYAVAMETEMGTLATQVIDDWLNDQPLVGGPQRREEN